MALGAATAAARLRGTSLLDQLLEEINFQRTKEMRQLLKDESGFVVVGGTTHWTDLFVRHFLFQEERGIDCDDLLFFVRKRHVRGSSRHLPKYEVQVEVFRKDSKKLPIGDPEVDWEETVYLNLVVHLFDYTLTLAVCTRTSPKELQVLRRRSHKVYASPSRRKMDTKGEGEEITYPHICFMVDNFDEVFEDIVVRDGEMVCVELAARGRGSGAAAAIFLGSIRYGALARVHECRQSSLSSKVAQRMSFGLLGGKAAARCEFVRMKGPGGKGHAEVAVSKPHGAGVDTPSSEPGYCLTDAWDSDCEDDHEDLAMYHHQRRMSDPSANLNHFARGGWKMKDPKDKSRSEDEGLDSLMDGVAEIEGGDVRDVSRRGSSASSCCWRPPRPPQRPHRHHHDSPACLGDVTPRRNRHVVATPLAKTKKKISTKKKEKDKECEIADDVVSLNERDIVCCETKRRTVKTGDKVAVRGQEELPCYREYDVVDLLKKEKEKPPMVEELGCSGGAGGGMRRARTWDGSGRGRGTGAGAAGDVPRRTTPDGTDIYYWCDMPRPRRRHELDDGWCHPLWAARGCAQSYHLWKEGRRQQSTPLLASLTYVTLPWWSIAKDILDHREEPILTF